MIIGISGKAGCGKSTAAKYLVEKFGFVEVSFASVMKKMLAVAGLPEPANRDDKEKIVEGYNFTWRHAAQTIGTEWGRNCLEENFWVKVTMAQLDPDKNYVFSDVRFENEAEAIISRDGVIVELQGRCVELGKSAKHASESGLSDECISYVIWNTKGLEYLQAKLDTVVRVEQVEL